MNAKQQTLGILVLVLSLALSGCGPGQLFGPTKPAIFNQSLVSEYLLSHGFTVYQDGNCSNPCNGYWDATESIEIDIWPNGLSQIGVGHFQVGAESPTLISVVVPFLQKFYGEEMATILPKAPIFDTKSYITDPVDGFYISSVLSDGLDMTTGLSDKWLDYVISPVPLH